MAIDYSVLAIRKPEPRKRSKRRVKRHEVKVAGTVRALCVERDGHCLIASRVPLSVARLLGPCDGPSEWMHIGESRRYRTRGQVAEERHTTAGSGMGCKRHHAAYDAHEFDIQTYRDVGMDGPLSIVRRAA